MTPRELLEELHATITTLIDERNHAVNDQARMDRINTCLREEVRVLENASAEELQSILATL